MLDTIAWVYKDNGEDKKAIDIYKNKIMPKIRNSKNKKTIEKFKKYYQKIQE
jgi:hypothetical protein